MFDLSDVLKNLSTEHNSKDLSNLKKDLSDLFYLLGSKKYSLKNKSLLDEKVDIFAKSLMLFDVRSVVLKNGYVALYLSNINGVKFFMSKVKTKPEMNLLELLDCMILNTVLNFYSISPEKSPAKNDFESYKLVMMKLFSKKIAGFNKKIVENVSFSKDCFEDRYLCSISFLIDNDIKVNCDVIYAKELDDIVSSIPNSEFKIKKEICNLIADAPAVDRFLIRAINERMNKEKTAIERVSFEKRENERVYKALISEKPFHELLHDKKRKVIAFVAPTNAAKTFHARSRLIEEAKAGNNVVAYFPLRALALENQIYVEEQGVPCQLITGEEKKVNTCALFSSQTIETNSTSRYYHTVLVDEAQLVFSRDRGAAYIEALLGSKCDTLILTLSPDALEPINQLFALVGETIEVIKLERLCKLDSVKPIDMNSVKAGDLLVAFNVKKLHEIALELSSKGFNTGMLYGKMSPTARRSMLEAYHSGSIDVMVATDSIGMGCNLPVKRVVFTELQKFDGHIVRDLNQSEMKQIAGRAGRFGKHEKGEYTLLTKDGSKFENFVSLIDGDYAKRKFELFISPSKSMVMNSNLSITESITLWKNIVLKQNRDFYKISDRFDDLSKMAFYLEDLYKNEKISEEVMRKTTFVVFDYNDSDLMSFLYQSIKSISDTFEIDNSIIDDIEDRNKLVRCKLDHLEKYAQKLSILCQLSDCFDGVIGMPRNEELLNAQDLVGRRISELILSKYKSKK